MQKQIVILSAFLLAGCGAGREIIQRQENNFFRRMPQMNRVEAGKPMAKGTFVATGHVSYAKENPDIMKISDSSFESRSSIWGDELTITNSSNTYCYESRIMASGEGSYAFSDVMSSGLSVDVSLGGLSNLPDYPTKSILNDNIEGAVFAKFAKQYGRLGVCLKPEFVMVHFYGDKVTTVSSGTAGYNPQSSTERLSIYAFSIRSSSVCRYNFTKNIASFLGAQIKSQPYPLVNDQIDQEVAYGIYGGLDLQYGAFALSPFIAMPLGSTATHYTSPISGGVQVSIELIP